MAISRRIALLQGHPDPARGHYCHALADAYAEGAAAGGHELRRIEIAELDFPLLRSQALWTDETPPPGLADAQAAIGWADHLVIVFPLWLGTMPALLKGFLEQVMRPGFAFVADGGRFPRKALAGKTARVVVTMGMPALWYRWFFRARGVRGLEQGILGFCGVKPVRESFIGLVEKTDSRSRGRWLEEMIRLGRRGT